MQLLAAAIFHLVGGSFELAATPLVGAAELAALVLIGADSVLAISGVPVEALFHESLGDASDHRVGSEFLADVTDLVNELHARDFAFDDVGLGTTFGDVGSAARATRHVFVHRGDVGVVTRVDDLEGLYGVPVVRVGPLDIDHADARPCCNHATLIRSSAIDELDGLTDSELLSPSLPVSFVCLALLHRRPL